VSITSLHVGIGLVTPRRSHGTACCSAVPERILTEYPAKEAQAFTKYGASAGWQQRCKMDITQTPKGLVPSTMHSLATPADAGTHRNKVPRERHNVRAPGATAKCNSHDARRSNLPA